MKKKIFAEIGFGNETFISTEIETKKDEYRINKFVIPKKIEGIYFRFWIFKKVLIISTKNGFEIKNKPKNKIKLLFGIQGKN